MTRKDFQLIASTIAALRFDLGGKAPDDVLRFKVAQEFSQALAETNPNFDAARFIAACQPKASKRMGQALQERLDNAFSGEGEG